MLATRFVAGAKDEAPASMYYAEGSAFQRSAPASAPEGTAAAGAEAYDGQGFDGKQEPCSPTKNAASARHTSVTGEARTPCASTLSDQPGACCAKKYFAIYPDPCTEIVIQRQTPCGTTVLLPTDGGVGGKQAQKELTGGVEPPARQLAQLVESCLLPMAARASGSAPCALPAAMRHVRCSAARSRVSIQHVGLISH